MRIALDYDDTYTRDPPLWDSFIDQSLAHGHDIRIVTFRSDNMNNEDIEESIGDSIPVIYTGGQRKRVHCYTLGFMVQVWIDDMPEIIVEDLT
jgi:hypothetical protein